MPGAKGGHYPTTTITIAFSKEGVTVGVGWCTLTVAKSGPFNTWQFIVGWPRTAFREFKAGHGFLANIPLRSGFNNDKLNPGC